VRSAFRRCAAPLAAGLLALPLAAGAWSGQQHIQINKAAGRNVPEEMAAFREFARPMALPGIYPDLWKESDPDEGPRHYFEPDRLPPGTDLRALSPVQIEAFLQMDAIPAEIGIAPWTIVELLGLMPDAMRTNGWPWAAPCGAALALRGPTSTCAALHPHSRQETWQVGVHARSKATWSRVLSARTPSTGPRFFTKIRSRNHGWVEHSAALRPSCSRDQIASASATAASIRKLLSPLWE
jgi:hypothetical protein